MLRGGTGLSHAGSWEARWLTMACFDLVMPMVPGLEKYTRVLIRPTEFSGLLQSLEGTPKTQTCRCSVKEGLTQVGADAGRC